MTSPIRKIHFGIADRHQMFRLFDRHAQRLDRWQTDGAKLYAGEWFEIAQAQHDYMLEILPPLWMRGEMFAMREFLTGSITSVFYVLRINGVTRYFHAYCDLSDPRSLSIRDAIVERERRPVKQTDPRRTDRAHLERHPRQVSRLCRRGLPARASGQAHGHRLRQAGHAVRTAREPDRSTDLREAARPPAPPAAA